MIREDERKIFSLKRWEEKIYIYSGGGKIVFDRGQVDDTRVLLGSVNKINHMFP